MANFEDPVVSASELADQVRALAYASRSFEDKPGDTYWVLGSLLSANRRLMQVYSQLASAHLDHMDLAHSDAGSVLEGSKYAHDAAAALRRAVFVLQKVDDELSEASQQSGRIAWYPSARAEQASAFEVDLDADGDVIALDAHRGTDGPDLSA